LRAGVRLIVWNSQGGKWGTFWQHYVQPALANNETVVGLLVESGWAPWIQSGEVTINKIYPIDVDSPRYQPNIAQPDDAMMVDDVNDARRTRAFWIPWVGNLAAMKTNSRCSIGGVIAPATWNVRDVSSIDVKWFRRPVLRVQLGPGNDIALTILLIHAVSGWTAGAQAEMDYLTSSMQALVPEGTSGVVVGDMNIDLLTITPHLPKDWEFLYSNQATQQSGGELDYGLLWDPTDAWPNADGQVLQQYKTGNNQSDHSVMVYALD
jgi:hypothetical protein